jgi:hypothetical protein
MKVNYRGLQISQEIMWVGGNIVINGQDITI